MTLNTVKPRSAITRLSPSMVCATDLLLGLVMTPSEACVLSSIRLPFEVRRRCARLREQAVSPHRGWGTVRTCLVRSSPHRELGGAEAVPLCGDALLAGPER